MKRIATLLLALGIFAAASTAAVAQLTDEMRRDGWVSIFNGTTLEGWRPNETGNNAGVFKVENGNIVGTGGRQHLYYMGEEYRNFELKIDVKINNDGNSGVYVKSQWQDNNWPTTGFELQVNSSHGDPQKSGTLYNIVRIHEAPHGDDEWFTYHIICNGNNLSVSINDKHLYTYMCQYRAPGAGARGGQGGGQATTPPPITDATKRIAQSGHIALQQHHNGSVVQFRNIFVKKLP